MAVPTSEIAKRRYLLHSFALLLSLPMNANFESLIPSDEQMALGGEKSFLPFDIITNILKRLPVKSIVRFQSVCKAWKSLFKTPSFIAEHARHSAQENPFLLIHAYDYNYRRLSLRLLNHQMETVEVLSTLFIDSFGRGWRIIGSCNGLLCVELDTDQGRFPISLLLWNPVTNEVRKVPQTIYDYHHVSAVGFGFSSVVNDYKIVRFYHPSLLNKKEAQHLYRSRLYCVQVYSLSTGSWKELEMGDLRHTQFLPGAVCANGTIFWYGLGLFKNMLVSFDIATEVFTLTPIDTFYSEAEYGLCPFRLDVYGNKLAMCDGYYVEAEDSKTYSIDMWVVEEGASKSGKSYSCTEKYRIGPLSNVLRPLCIWRNGIVCCKEKSEESEAEVGADSGNLLYLFNVTTKEWKKFHNCSAAYDQCDIFNYEKSLLSVLQHLG